MNSVKSAVRICLCLMGAAGLVSGCTTMKTVTAQTKKMVSALPMTGTDYKKRGVLLPFDNRTFLLRRDVDEMLTQRFHAALASTCQEVLWVKPGDPFYPVHMQELPKLVTGDIDNLSLARMGQSLGFQAVATGTVVNLEAEEKEKGIPFFKNTYYAQSVRINFQVFDTGTAAKLLDESLTSETDIDGMAVDALAAKDAEHLYELSASMNDIAEMGADKVCAALDKQRWEASVVSADGQTGTLPTGRESGLKPGDVLILHGTGEGIEGTSGQRFILPGAPVGRVTVRDVWIGKAVVIPLTEGTLIGEGFTVRRP